ncbi:DNA-processing protein DprA [Brevibacterium sp. VCM10]|uniref:DNA-processing protein DprA n=1 Tax=Brevibacterium sp. VCM10 TaxID=1381751 RepID=UPI0009DCB398|nr:DNA-processing protein DprA [Brevibacterium sp. VCM10]
MVKKVAKDDVARERAALVSLLTHGERMQWAQLRDRLANDEALPSMLVAEADDIRAGYETIEIWESKSGGANFYSYLDPGFPDQLRTVWDFPPFVFLKGDERPLDSQLGDLGVCIVGSRKPHPDSVVATERIAEALSANGITIVSGLAEGIDQAAHRAALRRSGRTVGVIGTGIDQYYPASSKKLQMELEAGHGMVLSQFIPGSAPTKYSFPMRNATMSAYGSASIIIEASEKSGTRHQARQAVRHGRPLILSPQVARETTWGRRLANDPLIDAKVGHTLEQTIELALAAFEGRSAPQLLTGAI